MGLRRGERRTLAQIEEELVGDGLLVSSAASLAARPGISGAFARRRLPERIPRHLIHRPDGTTLRGSLLLGVGLLVLACAGGVLATALTTHSGALVIATAVLTPLTLAIFALSLRGSSRSARQPATRPPVTRTWR